MLIYGFALCIIADRLFTKGEKIQKQVFPKKENATSKASDFESK